MFSLCLYEMTVSLDSMSSTRVSKTCIYFLGMTVQYFYFCNCSETADICQTMVRQSLLQCDWHAISIETRRNLTVMLAKIQRPNHLRFYNGMLVISRAFFLKVVKTAYTFVNFMRLKSA
ncbi:hypothetical protein WDU94_010555 [Cyamophila willieti]